MKQLFFVVMLCITTTFAFAQHEQHKNHDNSNSHDNHGHHNKEGNSSQWSSGRPDGHAPISVMGDHTHHRGGIMFSYRYMTMDMRQLRSGTDDTTTANAHANYMVAPVDMIMNMHMLGAMYALSDKITIMAMANYLENDMNLQMRNGNQFSTSTSGFGDVMVSALYSIFNKNRKAMHAQLGINIPTGSIEAMDVTPMSMGNDMQLPYPMQLGTGSFGAKLGLTYLGQSDKFSWGHQLTGMINFNDNDQDYKFGNQYRFNNWIGAKAGENLSVSIRLEGVLIDEIDGVSSLLNPMMVTTADVANSGGTFINSGFGVNYMIKNGGLKGLRFASEISTPLYQDLNGIQLKQNYNLMFGLQYAMH
ncbi:transporter [Hyunsoonleella sp. SJ7]|uniref:Transporter n=1 Tax=Hyunsoonleella aquatilis TaxID=2762758 RepID=A0A923H6I4_9FLAO|nr:transporter [Hyunsoonleella aquatilis]MBC3757021.1 transporter [Hyunsoonleella aquatilis]